MPIIVAPMSQQRMAYDEGELAVARAVAKEGTAMVSMHAGSCSNKMHGQGPAFETLHALCPLLRCTVTKSSTPVSFKCFIVFLSFQSLW